MENSIFPRALKPIDASVITTHTTLAAIMVILKLKFGLSLLVGSIIALIVNAMGTIANALTAITNGAQLLIEIDVKASIPKYKNAIAYVIQAV